MSVNVTCRKNYTLGQKLMEEVKKCCQLVNSKTFVFLLYTYLYFAQLM